MAYINNERYFSYNSLLDQSYDRFSLTTKRIEYIVKNLEKLIGMSETSLKELVEENKPFMQANRKRFLEKSLAIKLMNLFVDMKYE